MNNRVASPSQRFIATLYDLTIIFLPIMLVAIDIILLAVWRKVPKSFSDVVPKLQLAGFTVIAFSYFVLSTVSKRQATLGQRIMRIQVADLEMKRLGFVKSTLYYAPLGILMIIQQLFLGAKDLPSLRGGSVVHIAAAACWGTFILCYLYCLIDHQKASVFDRLLSVRVYRDEVPYDYILPQVQTVVALAAVVLCLTPLFKGFQYRFLLSFLVIFIGALAYGYHASQTRDLGQYVRRFVAFQPIVIISLIPSLTLGGVTMALVLYMTHKTS